MGIRNPRIDHHIAKSANLAQPILTHIREVVHTACQGAQLKYEA